MLPKTIDEDGLRNMFAPYGELREVHIIRGAEGSSKGCAFVKFVDREAAMVAIEDMHDLIPTVSGNDSFVRFSTSDNPLYIPFYQGSTRPLVVKFADSKKQGKTKEELMGMGDGIAGPAVNAIPSQQSVAKPDFWVKQYQMQLQQQQMLYTYGVTQQQQQQLFAAQNVPMMAYNNSPQQNQSPQFVFMQQNPGQYYSASGGHNTDVEQISRAVQQQQQPAMRQIQQQQQLGALRDISTSHISNDTGRESSSRGRVNGQDVLSNAPAGSNSHDILNQLGSMNSNDRSGASNQRPPEGKSIIVHTRIPQTRRYHFETLTCVYFDSRSIFIFGRSSRCEPVYLSPSAGPDRCRSCYSIFAVWKCHLCESFR